MKNAELFHKTVGILVKAYQNDTLEHENCYACAVGNLVAGSLGIKFTSDFQGRVIWEDEIKPRWDEVHCFVGYNQIWNRCGSYVDEGLEQIKLTGYLPEQTAKIEVAFETADRGNNEDEWMFNGLMSVVDTLMQIHEATTEEAQQAKELFVKA